MASETTKSRAPAPLPGSGVQSGELELGRITGVFGIQGEVRLFLHNPASEILAPPGREVVLLGPDGERRSGWLSSRSGAGKRILGRLGGVNQREQAREWMGWSVLVPEDSLPELDEDEFYVSQVEGAPVFVGERKVGRVRSVHESGPVDIFEIDTPDGPLFVPCLRELVSAVSPHRVELTPEALDED